MRVRDMPVSFETTKKSRYLKYLGRIRENVYRTGQYGGEIDILFQPSTQQQRHSIKDNRMKTADGPKTTVESNDECTKNDEKTRFTFSIPQNLANLASKLTSEEKRTEKERKKEKQIEREK